MSTTDTDVIGKRRHKLTKLAALLATRQQWKELADGKLDSSYKPRVPSYVKNSVKYGLYRFGKHCVLHSCFLCEYTSTSHSGCDNLWQNCTLCPLAAYWLAEPGRIYGKRDEFSWCETEGTAWRDYKFNGDINKSLDKSLMVSAAQRIVAMCDKAIAKHRKENKEYRITHSC